MTVHHFTFHITDKSDASDIREVETRAFGFGKEADLVASLLEDESARPALSLLARYEGKAVGHILFTRATFKGEMDSPLMHILAPGFHTGIPRDGRGRTVDTHWHRAPEVDGLPDGFCSRPRHLLPRHGFEPCAGDKGYPAPYPIPEEHKACWMMQSLTAQPMTLTGHIRCADPDETGALT